MRQFTIVLLTVLILVFLSSVAFAQNYVLCRSLLNSDVTAVFEGYCPSGWVFVAHV